MKTITDDKWKEDVWGSGLPDDPALYMYFGQNVRTLILCDRPNVDVAVARISSYQTTHETSSS